MQDEILYYFNRILRLLEEKIFTKIIKSNSFNIAPIFIIGSPRSGTTILKLLIIRKFKSFFITNFHEKFYGSPVIITLIFKLLRIRPIPENFNSNLGYIDGGLAPSEASKMWHNWFAWKPEYVFHGDFDPQKLKKTMRRSLLSLDKLNEGSVQVYKHVRNSLRIDALSSILPEAKFVVIKRKIIPTAYSIYKARISTTGNADNWWSIMPPHMPDINMLTIEEQIIWQIKLINKCIYDSLQQLDSTQYIEIKYEELLDNEDSIINKIKNHFKLILECNSQVDYSKKLTNRKLKDKIPSEIFDKFKKALVKVYGEEVDYA